MRDTTLCYALMLLFVLFFRTNTVNAQSIYCDSIVPSFIVDLTASPVMTWVSPTIVRDGNCCGTTPPDNCLEFVITLHPNAIAVSFNIASGAVPPGALFYQIDCGPPTPVGSPICLTGVGPHTLTFCKPGNNNNTFSVTSFSAPITGADITLNAGCSGFLYGNYYNEPSIVWNSVGPGAVGDYNYLLSCTTGCDTTFVTAPMNAPPYVDFLICGLDIPDCNPNPVCDTIRVNFVPPVNVTITSNPTFICGGGIATLTANLSGGTAPYSYLWDNGATTDTIVVGPGTYSVQVIDSSTCITSSDTITVPGYPLPVIIADPDNTVCVGTSITVNASGGVSYIWDNGVISAVPFIPPLGSTTYTVIGTDANGCQNTDQLTVTVNPLPIVNAGSDQSICVGTSAFLSESGNAVTYSWNNGVVSGIPFSPPVGTITYTVTGTDANGCVNTDQVILTVNPQPIVDAGLDQVVCEGGSVILIGAGALSYVWDNGIVDGVSFTPPVGTVTYQVIGTDANGCINTDLVTVLVNPLPVVDAGIDQTVCEGTSVTLNGFGATTYSWNNGVVNGVSFIPPVGTTTYTLTGTDINGCINTDQVNVLVNPLPIVDAGIDQVICEGFSVTLSGTGAVSYIWDNGVSDGVSFTPSVGSITYQVIGTDVNGCENSDQVDVLVNPLPIVDAGPDHILCEGSSITLNASGALTYVWDNGIVNGISFIPPVGITTYTVNGTDSNGCVNSDQLDILVNPLPIVDAGMNQVVCEGTSVILNASGATTYIWDNGVVDGISFVPPVGTTTYTVIGTDAHGCLNSDFVDVLVNPLPIVDAGPNHVLCEGFSVTLNGSGAISYTWDNGIVDGVSFIPPVGTTTYSVIGTDANGCENSDQVDVLVNPLPIVDAGTDHVLCEGTTITLSGSGAALYVWDNGVLDGVSFVPPVGTTTYSVIGTDANGCENNDQADVLVNPLPNVDAGIDQTVCEGTSTTLLAVGANSFVWDNGINNGLPFIQAVGTMTYTVIGTDGNNCINADEVIITVNPNPIVDAGADQSVCEETQITLSANGSPNMSWSNGITNGIPFIPTLGIQEYIVYDTLPTGCSASDTLIVEVLSNPIIFTLGDTICLGEGVALEGQGAISYVWNGDTQDGETFYPSVSGVYTVTGVDANGCNALDTAIVIVYDVPIVSFNILDLPLTTLDPTTGFENLTTGASSYEWDFGDGTGITTQFEPIHTYSEENSGEYTVTLTAYSPEGCVAELTKYIHVFQNYTIYVPNSFTPDDDEFNQYFKPEMWGFDQFSYVMYIYNRWGELIFETHDMNVGWDGTYASQDYAVQDGVFTWKIEATIKGTSDSKIFIGHVNLLR